MYEFKLPLQNNKINNLTQKQIQDIFSGKITNWKQIGFIDRHINIYTRDRNSGTRSVFFKKIMQKHKISKKAIFQNSNGAMIQAVQNDKYAIGFVSAGFITKQIKGLSIDAIAPTKANIQNGKYKFYRGLYSISTPTSSKLAKTFIQYLFSTHVQNDIVAKKGFVNIP